MSRYRVYRLGLEKHSIARPDSENNVVLQLYWMFQISGLFTKRPNISRFALSRSLISSAYQHDDLNTSNIYCSMQSMFSTFSKWHSYYFGHCINLHIIFRKMPKYLAIHLAVWCVHVCVCVCVWSCESTNDQIPLNALLYFETTIDDGVLMLTIISYLFARFCNCIWYSHCHLF